MLPTTPKLSQLAYDILKLNPQGYTQLVVRAPGYPVAYGQLSATDPANLINGALSDPEMAKAVACALWLWHDDLPEAHRIAQSIHSDTGAVWHGIMHRREGDFPNARHWFARCPNHPALPAIANQALVLLNDLPADNRLLKLTFDGWNAGYFVDLIETQQSSPSPGFDQMLTILQQLEWRVLIEYCASMA